MRKGRELERIVHALERCWSPSEAIVRSPDSIPDRITSEPREVDVSIRYNIGSVPVLVILECRDRHHVQDVTWIEQLAKKRDDVRAARAVAVSSSGFSEPAIVKARHEGIEIRTIEELTPEKIGHWRIIDPIPGHICRTEFARVSFVVSGEWTPSVIERIKIDDLNANVFYSARLNKWNSLNGIWAAMVRENDLFREIPDDGQRHGASIRLQFEASDRYALAAGEEMIPIDEISIEAILWLERQTTAVSRLYSYESPDGLRIDNAEYTVAVPGKTLTLTLHLDHTRREMGVTLRALSEDEKKEP